MEQNQIEQLKRSLNLIELVLRKIENSESLSVVTDHRNSFYHIFFNNNEIEKVFIYVIPIERLELMIQLLNIIIKSSGSSGDELGGTYGSIDRKSLITALEELKSYIYEAIENEKRDSNEENEKKNRDFNEGNEENSFIDYDGYNIKDFYPDITIKVERAQYSIFELQRKFVREQVILDPDFQRSDVWSLEQRSELVESVLMGIPLPIFYLSENKNGQLVVVDGKQRLTAFFKFFDNEFALKGLKILGEVEGKKFESLNQNLQSKLEDYQIIAQVIKPPTPDKVMFDIFDRVNRGGTRLNQQEMRNALYQGKATKLLKDLSKSKEFLEATGNSINNSRMKDRYMILRLISFYLWKSGKLLNLKGEKLKYDSGELDAFLGKAMESINVMDDQEIEVIKKEFLKTMRNNILLFGNNAFRRTYGERRYPVNLILFDCFGYLFINFDENTCYEYKNEFRKKSKAIMTDNYFSDLLTSDRGRGTSIKLIFQEMDRLKEVFENDI